MKNNFKLRYNYIVLPTKIGIESNTLNCKETLMMRAPQILLTKEDMKELKLSSSGIPRSQDGSTPIRRFILQKLLLPKTEHNDADRYFILSPICSSTAAFRFLISMVNKHK